MLYQRASHVLQYNEYQSNPMEDMLVKKYGVLLCDADDTIFDFAKAEGFAFYEAMRAHDLPSGARWLRRYSEINKAMWKMLERGEITQPVLRIKRFEQLLVEMGEARDASALSCAYSDALGRCAATVDGAEQAVRRWSERVPVVIVTNGIAAVQRGRMARSPIRAYISGMVISEEIGAAKPDPRVIQAALMAAKCADKAQALMLGDSLSSDIAGAVNAGVDSCWYNPHREENRSAVRPTYEIRSLEEVDALLP